jgi:hypothetical protein
VALSLGAVPAWPDEKPKPDDGAAKPEKPKVELSGYGQFDYRRTGADEARTAARHEVVGRRVRLGVSGSVNDRLTYAFTVQGDGLNANTASLLDASATVRLTSWARLQAGQYKYDFDLAGRESASLLTLTDRAFATQAIAGGLSGPSTPASPSGSYRDRGVTLSGDRLDGKVAYSIGGFQGNGRASDNNSSFALVARAQGSPARGLRLSVGFLDSDTSDEGEGEPGHYRAWTFGATFEHRALFLRGEYYVARRTRSEGRQSPNGFYLEATRGIRQAFEVLARYQRLDDPEATTAGPIESLDLGARYFLARRGPRGGSSLLANILLRDAPDGPLKGLTHLNDGRGAAVTTGSDLDPVFVLRLQVQF